MTTTAPPTTTGTTANTAVNPWPYATAMGYSLGTLVPTPANTLYVAGQVAFDANGAMVAEGDMAGQLTQVMDNVEAVLDAGGMTLSDVVRYDVYTTDMAAYFGAAGILVGRFAAAGIIPCGGIAAQVSSLAMPGLLVEIVCTAAR